MDNLSSTQSALVSFVLKEPDPGTWRWWIWSDAAQKLVKCINILPYKIWAAHMEALAADSERFDFGYQGSISGWRGFEGVTHSASVSLAPKFGSSAQLLQLQQRLFKMASVPYALSFGLQ